MHKSTLLILLALAGPANAAPKASPPPAPVAVPSGYHISPGDQLDIYVWGEERLQRTLAVLPDGTFAFPLAGTIQAAGKTPTDIESELSRLLAPQFKNIAPQVTVSVRTPSGMQVSVIGKVRAPGSFSPTRYVTVLDALAQTGGPTEFANVGEIVILRPGAGGQTSVIRVDLTNVLKGRPSQRELGATNIPQLMAGDTVVVP